MKRNPKTWKMPTWMEPYRQHFANTAGNSIEELMNGNDDPRVNLPLSTIQFGTKSQVALLMRLHGERLLPRVTGRTTEAA